MKTPFVLLLSVFAALVNATDLDCPWGCQIPLGSVLFNGSSPDDTYYTGMCANTLRVQSMFFCMKYHCNQKEIQAGLKEFSSECEEYGFIELLPWSIIDNITLEDAQSWPHIGVDFATTLITYDTPVFVSEEVFNISHRTAAYWNRSEVTRANYGYAMFGFWAGAFLIALVARLANYMTKRRSTGSAASDTKPSVIHSLRLASKRYVTTPALVSHHVAEPVGWCTVPQRLQSLTIFAFFVINLVLCCVSYELFEGNLYWADTRTQLWRYLSDRTGVLAIANMPFMFAFSMRNNVLLWLTGWDFATFNMFHRWVARIATLEAVLHSVGYTVEAFLSGGKADYVERWAEQYWWMGAIAIIAMCILCGASIYPVRKLLYEVFLLIHIVMAVLFLVGMWYHVAIFEGEYNGYIWPCVAVWVFDRVLRIGRVCYLNLPSFKATATYSAEADIIRVTVPIRSGIKPRPGTYYYLYGFNSLKAWESHPFTLSSWETKPNSNGQQSLTFLVRPHDSFTRRLRNTLTEQQSASSTSEPLITTRLALEGPYGHAHTLTHYNSIVFIIGGSGITVALSYLQSLHEALVQNSDLPLRQVQLVWAVRDADIYRDIHRHELAPWLATSPLANKVEFHLDVHVTRKTIVPGRVSIDESNAVQPITEQIKITDTETRVKLTADDKNIKSSSSSSDDSVGNVQISISNNRPSIHDLVLNAAETWCVRGERLGVICCGPAGMADDTRAAVVAAYARGHEGVDLRNESFSW